MDPTLKFYCELAQKMLENTIGLEDKSTGEIKRTCNVPAPLPCELGMVSHYQVMYDTTKKHEIMN